MQWAQIWQSLATDFPATCVIMDLILSLPAASAENERGFSRMKMTKTTSRTRLTAQSLTNVITIDMASPAIEDFDPEPAIIRWLEGGKRRRRPNFKDKNAGPAFKARRIEGGEAEAGNAVGDMDVEDMDVTEAGIIEDGVNAKDNEVEMLEAGVNQQKVGNDDGDDDDGVMNDSENDEGFDENDYMSDEEDNEMLEAEVLKRLEEMEDLDG